MNFNRKNPIKLFQHSFFIEDVAHLEATELPSDKEDPESYRVPALIVYLSTNSHPMIFEEMPEIVEQFLINSIEFDDYTQMILDYKMKKIHSSELCLRNPLPVEVVQERVPDIEVSGTVSVVLGLDTKNPRIQESLQREAGSEMQRLDAENTSLVDLPAAPSISSSAGELPKRKRYIPPMDDEATKILREAGLLD